MPALLQDRGDDPPSAAPDSPAGVRKLALVAPFDAPPAPAPEWAPRVRASHEEDYASPSFSRIFAVSLTLLVHLGLAAFLVLESQPEPLTVEIAPPAFEDTQLTWVDLAPEPPEAARPLPPPPEPPPRPVIKPKPEPPRAQVVEPEPLPDAPLPEPVAAAPEPAPAPVEPVAAEVTPPPPLIATPAPPSKPVSAAQARREQNAYVRELMAWLIKFRVYPDAAKKDKAQGVVQVRFTIDREGRVLASSVQKGAGHAALDAAALEVLSRASPLPRMPDSMRMAKLTITLPIEYSLIKD